MHVASAPAPTSAENELEIAEGRNPRPDARDFETACRPAPAITGGSGPVRRTGSCGTICYRRLAWGAGGRRFKSFRPDQLISRFLVIRYETMVTRGNLGAANRDGACTSLSSHHCQRHNDVSDHGPTFPVAVLLTAASRWHFFRCARIDTQVQSRVQDHRLTALVQRHIRQQATIPVSLPVIDNFILHSII
jgi:hypothetical protein